ncbi:MAG: alanine dehydrogenase [Pseudomonadota bacterium]|jgi:alanine dehydrogenase
MIIGVPKEIKNHEYRVGMVSASVRELTARNHTVFVQSGAGNGIGFGDADYRAAGADILASAAEVFAKAEMSVKVKEPQVVERAMRSPGQTLFTYLHLVPICPRPRS